MSDSIESQASQWSVILSSEDTDQHTLAEFHAWREADPRHEQAFQEVDKVWRGMEQLSHLRAFATLPKHSKDDKNAKTKTQTTPLVNAVNKWLTRLVRQPYPLAGAAFSLILALSIIWYQMPAQNSQQPTFVTIQYSTNHAEVQSFELSDKSRVALAPNSKITISYSSDLREVHLLAGEGLFNVSKNPKRPFIVHAGNTQTQVLGTVFNVKRSLKHVNVDVKEGKVKVSPSHSPKKQTLLSSGQGLVATLKGNIGKANSIDSDSIGAWVNGRLVYEDASLKDIIADANQYYKGKILLGSIKTGELRLAISFSTDNIDQMLGNLAQLLPISLNRERPGTVVVSINTE